jgi:peptidoglycan/LPS O-acetylase OafA/YrhL
MRHPDTFGRFSAGDALRGLSALGVLSLHVVQISMIESGPPGIAGFEAMRSTFGPIGFLGLVGGQWLDVFFVLSGYLIARPFVTAYVHDKAQPELMHYVRNRLLRVVPAFWVAVIATLLVFGLMGSSPWSVVLTMLFMQVFAAEEPFVGYIAQGWTLGTEMTFYALVPIVAFWWGRVRSRTATVRARRILAIAVAMFLLSFVWHELIPLDDPTWQFVFPRVAAAFAPGVAIAAVEATWPEKLATTLCGRLAMPVFITGIALFFLLAATNDYYSYLRSTAGYAGAALIVLGALMREWSGAPAWRLLKNGITDWLGTRSYSIYVLHYGVILWLASELAVTGHQWDTLGRIAPLTLMITLTLATLSWRWVEQPFLRLRKRWAKPRPTTVPAQQA